MKAIRLPAHLIEKCAHHGEFSFDSQTGRTILRDGRAYNVLIIHGTYISAVEGFVYSTNAPFDEGDVEDLVITNEKWWKGSLYHKGNPSV